MTIQAPWFDAIHCYHDAGCTLALTDEQIASAKPFADHNREYLRWPQRCWKVEGKVPSHDVDQNAYHVLYLANEMGAAGHWLGELHVRETGVVIDGNHRIRAVKFLFSTRNILIPEPSSILIYFRSRKHNEKVDAILQGRCEFLPTARQIVRAIEQRWPGQVEIWMTSSCSALGNQRPLDVLKDGELQRVLDVLQMSDLRSTG